MNSYTLKWIAIITMFIDHTAAVFLPRSSIYWMPMRCIGRLAFPIFVFLLVEGFHHTSNVKKYLFRLGLFALISEIPFDLAFHGELLEFTAQNVFFTLFLGLLCIYLMSRLELWVGDQPALLYLLQVAVIAGTAGLAYLLKTDYGYAGVILIVVFHLFRGKKVINTLCLLFVSGVLIGYINVLATFAMIPISFYNGQKGKSMKYFFYVFYPAHLLLFGLIYKFI